MSKATLQNFPSTFLLLQQEGYLISSCLALGLTELRNAHVHNKGAFYTALFNLSVGFERLLKAIVIIDHMLHNGLTVPTKKQLQTYGHNIIELYDACERIGTARQSPIPYRAQLDVIDRGMVLLLSDFACITRYHNLDALSASQRGTDPLLQWNKLMVAILDKDVSKVQKGKILSTAHLVAKTIDSITFTLMHDLDQKPLTTEEALSLPGLHDQAVRFAVLRLVNILSPFKDLIGTVSHKAYGSGQSAPPFPQMQEFLEWLWNDRQYVLRKKKWP